ncbi:MAG: UDP-N-acetylmuramoyl-L-alanine--D-glutamate ligase [Deltaproteobacteria bacterium]|nr:UDP-N-acetylmuramoyl-L-alanine--D-glutamate ligase [Deltaproteobacteria bacterium]
MSPVDAAQDAEAVAGEAVEAQAEAAVARLRDRAAWTDVDAVRFCVVGLGVSGVAAANALARLGADVRAYDDKDSDALAATMERLDPRVRPRCGGGFVARRGEIAVVSPGLSVCSAAYRRIAAGSDLVVGELELFARLDAATRSGQGHPTVAITGTDGKTTTTMLVDHLLRTAGHQTLCAGNIGEPLCNHVGRLHDDAVVVAEVSEFQLATTALFRPRIWILTNVADDHLDWFAGDREAYIASMTGPASRAGALDTVIYSAHDPAFAAMAEALSQRSPTGPRLVPISARQPVVAGGFGLEDGWLVYAPDAENRIRLLAQDALGQDAGRPMRGVHNVDNALGAAAAALAAGASLEAVRAGLRTFELPAHRLEPVGSFGGVQFVNDSKATNPHAAIHGLRGTVLQPPQRLAWIGGGSEKDADFAEVAAEVAERAHVALLIGQTALRLEQALLQAGMAATDVLRCEHLQEAIALGFQRLQPDGGVVLLSPACASFGMFRSYSHRGDVFREAVRQLGSALSRRS